MRAVRGVEHGRDGDVALEDVDLVVGAVEHVAQRVQDHTARSACLICGGSCKAGVVPNVDGG